MPKKKKEQTIYELGIEDLDGELNIPSFMIWLRKSRRMSQRELADLIEIPSTQIVHLEKSRQVFPYKTLQKIYKEVLTKAEREYFLTCMKGHIQLLMESNDDDEFREAVKTPNLIKKGSGLI